MAFNKRHELIKKAMWLSEEMGDWHDIEIPLGEGFREVIHQESIQDYLDWDIKTLKLKIINETIDILKEQNRDYKKLLEFNGKVLNEE